MPRRQTSDIGASRFSDWQEALCVIAIASAYHCRLGTTKQMSHPTLCLVTHSVRCYSTKEVMALAREVGQELTDKQIQDIAAAGDHWKDKKSCKSHVPCFAQGSDMSDISDTDFIDY